MKKFSVVRHWSCITDAKNHKEAIDKCMITYAEDYGIKDADWLAIRGGMHVSEIKRARKVR